MPNYDKLRIRLFGPTAKAQLKIKTGYRYLEMIRAELGYEDKEQISRRIIDSDGTEFHYRLFHGLEEMHIHVKEEEEVIEKEEEEEYEPYLWVGARFANGSDANNILTNDSANFLDHASLALYVWEPGATTDEGDGQICGYANQGALDFAGAFISDGAGFELKHQWLINDVPPKYQLNVLETGNSVVYYTNHNLYTAVSAPFDPDNWGSSAGGVKSGAGYDASGDLWMVTVTCDPQDPEKNLYPPIPRYCAYGPDYGNNAVSYTTVESVSSGKVSSDPDAATGIESGAPWRLQGKIMQGKYAIKVCVTQVGCNPEDAVGPYTVEVQVRVGRKPFQIRRTYFFDIPQASWQARDYLPFGYVPTFDNFLGFFLSPISTREDNYYERKHRDGEFGLNPHSPVWGIGTIVAKPSYPPSISMSDDLAVRVPFPFSPSDGIFPVIECTFCTETGAPSPPDDPVTPTFQSILDWRNAFDGACGTVTCYAGGLVGATLISRGQFPYGVIWDNGYYTQGNIAPVFDASTGEILTLNAGDRVCVVSVDLLTYPATPEEEQNNQQFDVHPSLFNRKTFATLRVVPSWFTGEYRLWRGFSSFGWMNRL